MENIDESNIAEVGLWNFEEYISNVHGAPQSPCSYRYIMAAVIETLVEGNSDEVRDDNLTIICPCYPAQISEGRAHDYCTTLAIFDGCPNQRRFEKPEFSG